MALKIIANIATFYDFLFARDNAGALSPGSLEIHRHALVFLCSRVLI